MADTERILDIRINYGDAIKKIAEYKESIAQVTTDEEKLQEQLKRGEITQQEYLESTAALKIEKKQYTDAIRVLNKEVDNELKKTRENEGSLKGLRAELSNLTKAYDEMSREEREGAKGKELQEHIMQVSNEIKQAEYATNRFYRNVGNYPKEVIGLMRDTYAATGNMKTAFVAGATATKNFGAQLAKLLLNPVVAFFAGIAAVVLGIVKVFNNSEERTNKLRQAMASLEPVLLVVKNAFSAIADVVVGLISAISNATSAVVSFIADVGNLIGITNNYNETLKETTELEKERQQAIEDARELMVEEAEADLEVAKLRDKVAQKDKYSAAERKKALQDAIKIEQDIADKRLALAKKNFENLEREAALADNDAEMNKKLAEAKRDLLMAEKQYYDDTRKMKQQLASFEEEERKEQEAAQKKAEEEEKKKADEAKRRAGEARRRRQEQAKQREADEKDAAQKEQKALQDAEDAILALVQDSFQRQYEQRRIQGEREIEALRNRLETEKNLTADAREAINRTILAKERKLGEDLTQMQAEQDEKMRLAEKAAYDAKVEANRARIQALQDALKEETEAYKRYLEDQQRMDEAEREIKEAKLDFTEQVFSGLSSLAEKFSADNNAMAKLSKILALGEVAVNTGKAIAAGVANAQSVPFPANLGAIATTVATVLTNMTTAISTIRSAKFAKGGTVGAYAGGGYVSGPGTGTSDSIAARLSNGESVNTALSTAMFGPALSAMNQMAGGNPISGGGMSNMGEAMLARAFAAGAASLPRPVVSVEEVTSAQNRVQAIESLVTI